MLKTSTLATRNGAADNIPSTLVELLKRRSAERPDAVGYTLLADAETERERVTYGELDLRARAIAIRLQRDGMAGRRALLAYPSGFEMLSGFFGCLYSGVVPIPYPLSHLRRETNPVKSVCKDADPAICLTTSSQLARLRRIFGHQEISMPVMATDSIPVGPGEQWSEPQLDANDLAYLQYTSGSTSSPKGVMITHRNVLHNLSYIDAGFKHDAESASVTWLPYYHDMGLVYGLLQPLYNGFPCWIMSPTTFAQRPIRWLEAISRVRATHSGGPSFAYDLCVHTTDAQARRGLDLSNWQVAFVGAEPVRSDTLERFHANFSSVGFKWDSFYPAYGLAEATLKVTGGKRDEGPVLLTICADSLENNCVIEAEASEQKAKVLVGCGNASHGVEIEIVDLDRGTACAELQVGEIWATGPGIARGYWERPEETLETFKARIPNRNELFLRTGDLGFIRKGELFVTGRTKDLIIIRGQNHYPQDIEQTAESCHADLGQAGSFCVEVDGQERLVILQETRRRVPGDDLREAIQTLRRAVASEHELEVHTIALIPAGMLLRTSSGKLRRQASRAAFLSGDMTIIALDALEPRAEGVRPNLSRAELLAIQDPARRRDRLVTFIVEAAGSLLDVDHHRIDPSQPSNHLALDSVNAVALQGHVEDILRISLQPLAFLQSASIVDIASQALVEIDADLTTPRKRPISMKDEPADIYQLSPEQERIWMLSHSASSNTAYNLCFSFQIRGALNISALEESVKDVLYRQAALRTAFPVVDGRPVQRVLEFPAFVFPLIDLSGLPWRRSQAAIARIVLEMRQRSFDLSKGPLLRFCLLRLDDATHLFPVAAHHIIIDAASFDIFLREIASSYEARSNGDSRALRPVSPSFAEYSEWQRAWLKDCDLRYRAAFWRELLTPPPTQLRFPARRNVARAGGAARNNASMVIPDELLVALKELSRHEGATLFMALLAAFKATLSSYSGEADILVASPTIGRPHPEIRQVIGFFAHPVLLRTDLSGDPSFIDLLRRVRDTVLSCLAHADIPFVSVLESVSLSDIPNPGVLIDILFNFVNTDTQPVTSNQVTMGPLELQSPTTDAGMFMNVYNLSNGLNASLTYDPRRFSDETASEILEIYSRTLTLAAHDPEVRLSQLTTPSRTQRLFKISIASSFVSEPLKEILDFWSDELELEWQIELHPYGQIMQPLLDSNGSFLRAKAGLRVLLIRLEDWAGGGPDELRRAVRQFVTGVTAAAEPASTPILICLCPASPAAHDDNELSAVLDETGNAIANRFAEFPVISVLTPEQVARLYPMEDCHNSMLDGSVNIPYVPEWFAAMGTMIARRVYGLLVPQYKAIAIDCDDTLWDGVCGEDGTQGVRIDGGRRALQKFLLRQKQNGMLLCLCSKNNFGDVERVFRERSDMLLCVDDLAATRVNWESKSTNLRSLAAELGIGLDSFIFIDDNPIECAEVRQACPQVLTLQLDTAVEESLSLLNRIWAFDVIGTTAEARSRTALYRSQHQRDMLKSESLTLTDYLEGLNLKVEFQPLLREDIERVFELTLRVNQFNCRYTRGSERAPAPLAPGVEHLVVKVTDRFGPYGLVGVISFRQEADAIVTDDFLLSCRALGRGVEHKMLAELGRIALQRGCRSIRIHFVETARNAPARAFLEQTAGSFAVGPPGPEMSFDVPVEYACDVTYEPGSLSREIADDSSEELSVSRDPNYEPSKVAAQVLLGIAERLGDPYAVLEAVNARRSVGWISDSISRIEHCLRQHPAVRHAMVLRDDYTRQQTRFVAFVAETQPGRLTSAELQHYLSRNLTTVRMPSAYLFLEEFPQSSDGSVDLSSLRRLIKSGVDIEKPVDPLMTPTERLLAKTWVEILGLDSVGVNESFFDLGGDSLLATQILSRIRDDFHVELPITILFTSALTVAELAIAIERQQASSLA